MLPGQFFAERSTRKKDFGMLFNSLKFALFFPCVTAGYFILPHRLRNLWLLGCSYLFYMC